MKMLTHNLLMCNVKNCGQFPLSLAVDKADEVEAEYNESFMLGILEKIEYGVIVEESKKLSIQLPATIQECELSLLHKVLLGIEILEGKMICDKCNHIFTIANGIPNMLLNPNEV
eukprot:NODE_132_length_18298_cov_0.443101.p14 type:complete len:115 gc:universal NODE_132_length_18298_cov_0.443101:6315-5971(-)